MSVPSDFHFYQDIFEHLNDGLNTYVNDVAQNIIQSITGVAYSLLMIYMMLWGWMMLRGMISEPITDGVVRIIRLSMIVGIALNLGRYNTYVSDFLWNTPEALAAVVASGYSENTSIIQFLDSTMGQIYDLGDLYWQKGVSTTIPNVGLNIVAILIWVAGVAATGYAAFLFALSKIALAILLGIGPLFILLLIFDATKRFFESWLGQAINYVFLVCLTAGTLKLITTVLITYLQTSKDAIAADPKIVQALPGIVMCVVSALVMMQLSSIASALGGGAAINTLGAVGWAYKKAFRATAGALSAMRPTTIRRGLRNVKEEAKVMRGVYRKITGGMRKNKIQRS